MKIVLAPDSFKGTLSAQQVCDALSVGLRRARPDAEIDACPMADGGEGTCDALIAATAGRRIAVRVADPLMRRIEAAIGVSGDGRWAFVEMAAASGLTLLQEAERNPLHTTTFGTGELLTAALQTGVVGIILGIGGSATVDLGAGCLQALGVRFLDAMGNALPAGLAGGALTQVASVDAWGLDPRWKATELMVACDVDNPLLGANGAAAVYGPQKGAKAKREIELLEWNLAHLAKVFRHRFGQDVSPMEGAGAAGGLGAGLCAVCGARLKKGCEVVAAAVALPQRLQGAGLVITGEGRLDAQTKYGKVVAGVAALANRLDVPCVAIVGTVDAKGADVMPRLARCESLFDEPVDLQMARHKTPQLLADAAQRLAAQWPA